MRVAYSPVIGKEKEAQIGLDRAFDLLFQEILKVKMVKRQTAGNGKLKTEFDNSEQYGES